MQNTLPDLTAALDSVAFVGLAIANVHTGFNVSIEIEPGCWSPQVFATSPSEAILKCLGRYASPAPPIIPPPPY